MRDPFFKEEIAVLRKFTPGPGNWVGKLDLFHLLDGLGFSMSYPSVATTALAAKLRVAKTEIKHVEMKHAELQNLLLEHIIPPLPRTWYEQSCVSVLARTMVQCRSIGVTAQSIKSALKPNPRSNSAKIAFQKEAYKQLLQKGPDKLNIEWRLRERLGRWQVQLAPRIVACRSMVLLKRIAKLVAPRVWVVVFKTLYNAWCTKRRFQEQGCCVFKCNPQALDAIEHYCHCPVFRKLHTDFLRTRPPNGMQEFLLLNHSSLGDDGLITNAVALYALFTAFNHFRINSPCNSQIVKDFLERSTYHGVLNHPRSRRVLQDRLKNFGRP